MKKRDLILIGSILAIIIVSFVAVNIVKQDGAYVVVRVDGAEVAKYSLDKDGEYEINGGSNVLKIENGELEMTWTPKDLRAKGADMLRARKIGG